MKKFLTFIGSMMVCGPLLAATAFFHLNANSTTSLFTNGFTFSQIIIANTNASTVANIVLFDTGVGVTNNAITNVIPAYTNFSYVSQSETNIYTNYFGVATTNIFTSLTNTASSVAATTNLQPVIVSITAPAATTTVIQLNGRGLLGCTATNSASADLTFTYRQ